MSGKTKFVLVVLCAVACFAATRHLWNPPADSLPDTSIEYRRDGERGTRSPDVGQPTILRADSSSPVPIRPRRESFAVPIPDENSVHEFGGADNERLTPSAPDVTNASKPSLPSGAFSDGPTAGEFVERAPPSREFRAASPGNQNNALLSPQEPTSDVAPLVEQPAADAGPRGGPGKAKRIVLDAPTSFWTLSEEHYGSAVYYKALFVHNRERVTSPDKLEAGLEIDLPDLDELRSRYAQYCPATSNALRSSSNSSTNPPPKMR